MKTVVDTWELANSSLAKMETNVSTKELYNYSYLAEMKTNVSTWELDSSFLAKMETIVSTYELDNYSSLAEVR